MKKLFLVIVWLLAATTAVQAQQDTLAQKLLWAKVKDQISNQHYSTAYRLADSARAAAMRSLSGPDDTSASRMLLVANWFMTDAALFYQENAVDSAEARYRRLMPLLNKCDRAICHLLLNEVDSAMADTAYLATIPIADGRPFCQKPERCSFNLTPTMYDLVMTMAVERSDHSHALPLLRAMLSRYAARPLSGYRTSLMLNTEIDIIRRTCGHNSPSIKNKIALWQDCLNRYSGERNTLIAQLHYEIAQLYEEDSDYLAAVAHCDSACNEYPKSEAGISCFNLRENICRVEVKAGSIKSVPDGRRQLVRVTVRNTNHLYYKVIKEHEFKWKDNDAMRKEVMRRPILAEWDQPLNTPDDHRTRQFYGYAPELPIGDYILLTGPQEDFLAGGFDMTPFSIAPAVLVLTNTRNGIHGHLVDYATGLPIAGQKVTLEKEVENRNTYTYHCITYATATTNEEGFFSVSIGEDWQGTSPTWVCTRYKGFNIQQKIFRNPRPAAPDTSRATKLMTDRPIYRPGDTAQFLLLAYDIYHNSKGQMLSGMKVKFFLMDPNDKKRDSLETVTDDDGAAIGRFAIAPDVLPGRYTLQTQIIFPDPLKPDKLVNRQYNHTIRVESYKQPKFTVTLNSSQTTGRSPQLGDSLAVEGLAASYSQVPVSGAQVVYSVSRKRIVPWWYYYRSDNSKWYEQQLVSDTLATDPEGHFRIAFAALPDTDVAPSEKPLFSYTVSVTVTDLAGETHSQTKTLKLGYTNSYLAIDKDRETDDLSSLRWRYNDLNDTPLKGDVTITVERLRQPGKPYLPHPNQYGGFIHTMGEREFRERYPLTSYSPADDDISRWPAEKTVHTATLHASGLTSYTAALPKLDAGAYRIRLSCDGTESETVVAYMPRDAKHVVDSKLLWTDFDKTSAIPGETVTLRVGSRHSDLFVICQVLHNDSLISHQTLRLDNNIKTLSFPITDQLLGGFEIQLFTVKEGRNSQLQQRIEVPFEHKKLDVEFVTFRDRLTPGEKETWTLQVRPNRLYPQEGKSRQVVPGARMLLGMYDAALDSYYGSLGYELSPWLSLYSTAPNTIHPPRNYTGGCWRLVVDNSKYRYYSSGSQPQGWSLQYTPHFLFPSTAKYRKRLGVQPPLIEIGTAYSGMHMASDEIAHMPGTAVESAVASVGGVGYDDTDWGTVRGESGMVKTQAANKKSTANGFVAIEAEEAADGSPAQQADEVYVRQGLSTLAFFNPNCRTDDEGMVSFSFDAPDLLTQWNALVFAWNRDLCTGSASRQLVTRKQLMIQPNMPRFLREGDTASLLARVSNLTDSAMMVRVTFSFEVPGASPIEAVKTLLLPPNATKGVSFPVRASCGGTVAVCRFVAAQMAPAGTPRHSDGEQSPLPLLTNRQAVTASLSMFANGAQDKEYSLDLPASPTAQPVSLTVEYTANPIWLAIQSLPYMSDRQNPSNIYLFNSWYVNSLGLEIAHKYPELKESAANVTGSESPLFANADIKQTLLEETPWLRDGTDEADRLRRIANYYDEQRLRQQLDQNRQTLDKEQRRDGSWTWMPGGKEPSLFTTQYILRGLGQMARRTGEGIGNTEIKALGYIDYEAYKYYTEWQRILKKHPEWQCEPINLDYLYTRSFYGDKRLSKTQRKAYDFFYANLKKNFDDYTSLYSQALLALIFQRHGDTKLAREMVTRLREKALYSEEMGMYWRDNISGWFFYQRPVETQALLIETFREVVPDDTASVARMQQWLLKQKQTTSWNTDIATLRAIQALTDGAGRDIRTTAAIAISGGRISDTLRTPSQGAGYLRHTYRADSLDALIRNAQAVTVKVNTQHETPESSNLLSSKSSNLPTSKSPNLPSWGALFYQYTELMDRVPASETGITMRYEVLRVNPDGTTTPADKATLRVGDRLRITLHVECDRNLEYVELKSHRAACLEPVNTRSGWRWNTGLSYYEAINNSHDALYIDRLDKGKYVIETNYYITNPGDFTLAPAVLQCLYAPEFRATSAGRRIVVAE